MAAGPENGTPGRIRTSDHLVRSQVLYPAELRAHCVAVQACARTDCIKHVQNESSPFCRTLCRVQIPRCPRSVMGQILTPTKLAESEGFEPSMGVNPYTLSRGAPSATRPALLTRAQSIPVPAVVVKPADDVFVNIGERRASGSVGRRWGLFEQPGDVGVMLIHSQLFGGFTFLVLQ